MKILFVGGYGNISWWCMKKALDCGNEVYLLNRRETLKTRREIPAQVRVIEADYRNVAETKQALDNYDFDVVCDFICYNDEHAKAAIDFFSYKTRQYVFISSESVYQRLSNSLPFSETSPRYDESMVSSYIGDKLRAEKVFIKEYERNGFPLTIVRPGLTYDTIVPVSVGHNCFTVPQRCLDGKPLYVAGEGNNLCAFTNSRDFADLFNYILGNGICIGEDYNIATTQWHTWNEASELLLDTLKIKDKMIVHIPFYDVLKLDLPLDCDLMYQRMFHLIFDISKIKKIVGDWKPRYDLKRGLGLTIDWLYENDAHRRIVPRVERQLSVLDKEYGRAWREV